MRSIVYDCTLLCYNIVGYTSNMAAASIVQRITSLSPMYIGYICTQQACLTSFLICAIIVWFYTRNKLF